MPYTIPTDEDGSVTRFAWPGGYEMFYVTDDGGVLCAECVNAERVLIAESDPGDGWYVIGHSHTGETDEGVQCDHCYRVIQEAWDA